MTKLQTKSGPTTKFCINEKQSKFSCPNWKRNSNSSQAKQVDRHVTLWSSYICGANNCPKHSLWIHSQKELTCNSNENLLPPFNSPVPPNSENPLAHQKRPMGSNHSKLMPLVCKNLKNQSRPRTNLFILGTLLILAVPILSCTISFPTQANHAWRVRSVFSGTRILKDQGAKLVTNMSFVIFTAGPIDNATAWLGLSGSTFPTAQVGPALVIFF